MKLFQYPLVTIYVVRLFLPLVRTPLQFLLCSLTLCSTTLLTAAPAQAQKVSLPLTFEQNRGQAPNEVKWIGQGSSYRVLLEGNDAEKDTWSHAYLRLTLTARDTASSHALPGLS